MDNSRKIVAGAVSLFSNDKVSLTFTSVALLFNLVCYSAYSECEEQIGWERKTQVQLVFLMSWQGKM
jgi:uncharacterized membrane protein